MKQKVELSVWWRAYVRVKIMVLNVTFNNISAISWWSALLVETRARCTTLFDKACQWLATGRWFSSGFPVSTNKADHHDIAEILLKVTLSTIIIIMKQKVELSVWWRAYVRVKIMVLNVTFNNISAISWWSALLVETGKPCWPFSIYCAYL
jgi:hypothetical protein